MPKIGFKLSEEHKKKLSEAGKGKHPSLETRKKIGEASKGRHHSEESKLKISQAHKGEKHPLYGKKGEENPNYGRKNSDEAKRRMSEARKEKYKGKDNPNWKGGITKDKKHMRELFKRGFLKHRALKKEAIGSFTLAEWELLKKQYGNRCPLCREEEPAITLTIDHIIPLSKGGSNYIENIQPLCKPCNSKKHTGIFRITPKGELMLF